MPFPPLRRTLGTLALLLLAPALAFAAPRWVRVSIPGQNAATSMVVAWNSDSATDATTVQYGTSASALSKDATGTSFLAKGQLGAVHEVTLQGLLPATTYFYRVGGDGAWSANHQFTTAPADACGAVKFIASGDHRSDDDAGPNPKWKSILAEMVATGATLILETGDLVKDGADLKQWVNHMEMGSAHMGEVALMPSFGNHDSDDVLGAAAAFNQIFALPANTVTSSEDFYAFEYGNAVIVALSTATYSDASGLAGQAQWLDETLTKYKDKMWKFVFFHHPCYTSYIDLKFIDLNHPPDEKKQNALFVPIFDKHHVDIVFAGHNHFYERFAPMKGGAAVASPKDGTVYVTTGGAGAFTYDTIDVLGFKIEPMKVICGEGILGMSGKAKGSQYCTGKHHYVEVAIEQNVLTATVRATAAQNLSDSAANKGVIETFQIKKDPLAPGTCGSSTGGADAGSTADAGSAPDVATAQDTAAAPDAAAPDAEAPDVAPDVALAPDAAPDDGTASAEDVAAPPEDTAPAQQSDAAGPALTDTATLPNTADAKETVWVPTKPAAAPAGSCTAATRNPGGAGGAALLVLVAGLAVLQRRRSAR